MTAATKEDKWLAANPLRRYREQNERDVEWAASRLGVTAGIIRGWEAGRYKPKNEARTPNGSDWTMLSQLLGGDVEALWAAWLAKAPDTAKED